MSRASAVVRFEDGTVKHAVYNGTSDVLLPRLFDTSEEAWAASGEDDDQFDAALAAGSGEPVQVYTNYADGHVWNAHATRGFVVSNFEPSFEAGGPDGYADCNWTTPEWARP